LAAGAAACSPRADRPPHVVCVLVDQLRKDSFDSNAPKLRALAEGGVVFDSMRSVAPWTYPSVISMMSGLLPQQHGADGFRTTGKLTNFSLEVPLVHRLLRAAGWYTAGFVTNPFLREWNPFHVGFDFFAADFVKNLGNNRMLPNAFSIPERMFANSVNEEAKKHFDARPVEDPEFTYIHYIDAHGPWTGAPFTPHYFSAIHYLDERITEMYEYFRARYDGNVVFLITSDHGRAFRRDVMLGSGPEWRKNKESLHEFNVRIPFVILPGDGVAAGHVVEAPCANVDFTPTVLDLAGVTSSVTLAGQSLVPHIRGDVPADAGADRGVYLRMSAFGNCCDALVLNRRKYFRFIDCGTGEIAERRVFDLEKDPRETSPLDEDFGEVDLLIQEASEDQGLSFETSLEPLSEELEDQLRALGYVD